MDAGKGFMQNETIDYKDFYQKLQQLPRYYIKGIRQNASLREEALYREGDILDILRNSELPQQISFGPGVDAQECKEAYLQSIKDISS